VEPACQDAKPVIQHLVDKPVFIVDTFRPASRELVLERLGLADAAEWIGLCFLDETRKRSAFLRSVCTHQARSSNAAASNSKLRTGVLERDTVRSLLGRH
jgi:hypothetical protein